MREGGLLFRQGEAEVAEGEEEVASLRSKGERLFHGGLIYSVEHVLAIASGVLVDVVDSDGAVAQEVAREAQGVDGVEAAVADEEVAQREFPVHIGAVGEVA